MFFSKLCSLQHNRRSIMKHEQLGNSHKSHGSQLKYLTIKVLLHLRMCDKFFVVQLSSRLPSNSLTLDSIKVIF